MHVPQTINEFASLALAGRYPLVFYPFSDHMTVQYSFFFFNLCASICFLFEVRERQ